jgi:transposase
LYILYYLSRKRKDYIVAVVPPPLLRYRCRCCSCIAAAAAPADAAAGAGAAALVLAAALAGAAAAVPDGAAAGAAGVGAAVTLVLHFCARWHRRRCRWCQCCHRAGATLLRPMVPPLVLLVPVLPLRWC